MTSEKMECGCTAHFSSIKNEVIGISFCDECREVALVKEGLTCLKRIY